VSSKVIVVHERWYLFRDSIANKLPEVELQRPALWCRVIFLLLGEAKKEEAAWCNRYTGI